MNTMKKAVIGIIVICISFITGFKMSDYRHNLEVKKEKQLQQQFEEYETNKDNQYLYPQEKDAERGISVTYTSDVLTKKSNEESLSDEEKALITYYKVQNDGYGIAITHFHEHDGGMGKATRRIWETSDAGSTWNVLAEQIYNVGYYDFSYIGNVFIESAFSTTAEAGYFNISDDRGHRFISIAYGDVFEYDGVAYAKKLTENTEEKTITYQWMDLYSKETIATVEYDLKMNIVNEIN